MKPIHRLSSVGLIVAASVAAMLLSCNVLELDEGPGNLFQPAGGYFYVLDRASVSIIQFDAQMRELRRWDPRPITNDESLQGIAFDGTYLWVSVAGNADRIYQLDAGGDSIVAVNVFDAPPSRQGTTRDLAWDGSSLWSLNSGSSTYQTPPTLYKLNPADGSILAQFVLPSPEPRGLTYVGPNGDAYGRGAEVGLYYTDVTTNRIYKFRTERSQFDTAFAAPIPPRGTSYIYPVGITFDGKNFWVVNSSNTADHLHKLSYNGREEQRLDLPFGQPGPIAWTSQDVRTAIPLTLTAIVPNSAMRGVNVQVDMYGTGFRPGPSLAVDFGAGISTIATQFLTAGQLRCDISVASDAEYAKRNVTLTNGDGRVLIADTAFAVTPVPPLAGHLYLADQQSGGYVIHKIRAADTLLVKSWPTTSVSSGSPQGIAFDGTNLWLCASGTDKRLYKLDTTGTLTALNVLSTPPTAGTLRGIVWDSGSLWLAVSGSGSARIYKLNPTTGAILDSVNTPGAEPRGIAIVAGTLYCNDTSLDSVFAYNPANATWAGVFATPTPPGGTTSNRFATGLTWDGSNFWIANSTGNFDHVFRMTPTGIVLQYFSGPNIGNAQLTGLVYTPN